MTMKNDLLHHAAIPLGDPNSGDAGKEKSKPVYSTAQFSPGDRLLAFPEVQKILLVSKTRWYDLMKQGDAPRPLKIGHQKVCWLESEILEFINLRIKKRNDDVCAGANK